MKRNWKENYVAYLAIQNRNSPEGSDRTSPFGYQFRKLMGIITTFWNTERLSDGQNK
jgi:hypothetical protein